MLTKVNTRENIHFIQGRFSNRKSNTLHNILKANCQLFFLAQFARLYIVLSCTLSLTEFVRLYFVLQPQVFQLVVRQPLTQVVFFAVALILDLSLCLSVSLSLCLSVSLSLCLWIKEIELGGLP